MPLTEIPEHRRAALQKRFDVRHTVDASGCWPWIGGADRGGYGRFYVGDHTVQAHRASWMLHRGPIPEGKLVCHHCDVPGCVNPDHLFVGTDGDNAADRSIKFRSYSSTEPRGRIRKLTEDDVRRIRTSKRSCGQIAREIGVHPNTISKVRRGIAWKHVDAPPEPDRPRLVRIDYRTNRDRPTFSDARGGFILGRRKKLRGDLIGYLRPTEFSSAEEAKAAAVLLAATSGDEFAVFQQVATVIPSHQKDAA